MHPTASNCTTISRPSLSEEVGDFAFFHCLLRSRWFVEMIVWTPKGGLGIGMFETTLVCQEPLDKCAKLSRDQLAR